MRFILLIVDFAHAAPLLGHIFFLGAWSALQIPPHSGLDITAPSTAGLLILWLVPTAFLQGTTTALALNHLWTNQHMADRRSAWSTSFLLTLGVASSVYWFCHGRNQFLGHSSFTKTPSWNPTAQTRRARTTWSPTSKIQTPTPGNRPIETIPPATKVLARSQNKTGARKPYSRREVGCGGRI